MKATKKRSFSDGVPSSVLALIVLVVAFIFLFVLAAILSSVSLLGERLGEPAAYILYAILLAISGFYICRQDPKSVWCVPIIINIPALISGLIEPNFWTTSLWFFFGNSVLLSVIGSCYGAIRGKKGRTN